MEGIVLLRILSVIDVIRSSAVAVALVIRVALSVISTVALRVVVAVIIRRISVSSARIA